jgi:hypothetical protein
VSFPPALEGLVLASLCNDDFDFIRAASAVQLQLDPGTATAAPEPSTRADPSGTKPVPAAAAFEPSAPREPVPAELASETDTTLPDLPPPELRRDEAETGGGGQVEAPDAAPTDDAGTRVSVSDQLPGSGAPYTDDIVFLQVSSNRRPETSRDPRGVLVRY